MCNTQLHIDTIPSINVTAIWVSNAIYIFFALKVLPYFNHLLCLYWTIKKNNARGHSDNINIDQSIVLLWLAYAQTIVLLSIKSINHQLKFLTNKYEILLMCQEVIKYTNTPDLLNILILNYFRSLFPYIT